MIPFTWHFGKDIDKKRKHTGSLGAGYGERDGQLLEVKNVLLEMYLCSIRIYIVFCSLQQVKHSAQEMLMFCKYIDN